MSMSLYSIIISTHYIAELLAQSNLNKGLLKNGQFGQVAIPLNSTNGFLKQHLTN